MHTGPTQGLPGNRRPGAPNAWLRWGLLLAVLCGSWGFQATADAAGWRGFKRKWPKLWIQKNPCDVYKVVDGDTVHVMCDGKKEKLRLVGIDTPETKHPFKPIEYYGPEASARAKGLMPKGSKVWLGFARRPNGGRGLRGKYGRLLAFLFIPGKGLFNALMVREGYALAMRRYPNIYKRKFIRLEGQAKRAKRGMWSNMRKVRAMMAGDKRYRAHRKRCKRKHTGGRFNWVIGDSATKFYYTRRNGGTYFRTNPGTRVLFCSVSEATDQGYKEAPRRSRRYRRRGRRYRRGARLGSGGRKIIIGDTKSQKFYVFQRGSYQIFRSIRAAKEAGFRRARKRRRRRRARRKRRRTRRKRRRRGGGGGSVQKPNCGGKTPIVSNRRSKKYRLPSQRSYKRATRSKNAVYFCTEQQAINAGHTKAKR